MHVWQPHRRGNTNKTPWKPWKPTDNYKNKVRDSTRGDLAVRHLWQKLTSTSISEQSYLQKWTLNKCFPEPGFLKYCSACLPAGIWVRSCQPQPSVCRLNLHYQLPFLQLSLWVLSGGDHTPSGQNPQQLSSTKLSRSLCSREAMFTREPVTEQARSLRWRVYNEVSNNHTQNGGCESKI